MQSGPCARLGSRRRGPPGSRPSDRSRQDARGTSAVRTTGERGGPAAARTVSQAAQPPDAEIHGAVRPAEVLQVSRRSHYAIHDIRIPAVCQVVRSEPERPTMAAEGELALQMQV